MSLPQRISKTWLNMWQSEPPGLALLLFGLMVALVMMIPIVYVLLQSLSAGSARWLRLFDQRVPQLLFNTVSLALAVTFTSSVLGISTAWLVVRTDLPARRLWRWLLALPLVIPPYVGAVTFIIAFGENNWSREILFSFTGVFLVLSLFTYPYVYLIASAALRKMNRNLEEAAASAGMSAWRIFWHVNLPLLRPAIGAGAILTCLYVIADFGAVSMLRYVTFTAAIYFQRAGLDMASASILSLVLVVLTMFILWMEGRSRSGKKYYQTANSRRKPLIFKLGRWKVPTLLYVLLLFAISVMLPIVVLINWSRIGLQSGAIDYRFWGFAFNSLKISGLAALLCMALSMPIIYLKSRHQAWLTLLIDRLSYTGYALPGIIIGLGFVVLFNNNFPMLYGTVYVVLIAFVTRFLPQAMQAGDSSLQQISPKIDEAARNLGYPPWKVMIAVIFPNMLPGILAGGSLVFVSAMKELPITLMLRPPGFDTLAVRVFFEANEALYFRAAPAALLIVFVSLIPLYYLLNKH